MPPVSRSSLLRPAGHHLARGSPVQVRQRQLLPAWLLRASHRVRRRAEAAPDPATEQRGAFPGLRARRCGGAPARCQAEHERQRRHRAAGVAARWMSVPATSPVVVGIDDWAITRGRCSAGPEAMSANAVVIASALSRRRVASSRQSPLPAVWLGIFLACFTVVTALVLIAGCPWRTSAGARDAPFQDQPQG